MGYHDFYFHQMASYPDWSALVGIIAALAALITAIATWMQVRALKLSTQAETLTRFLDRFDSEEFKVIRKRAAMACHTNIKTRNPDSEVDDVLDFFDDIALFVQKRAMDKEMAWHGFYHWIRLYCQASEHYIRERREKEPAVWAYLLWLYPELLLIEGEKGGGVFIERLSDTELDTQLKEEVS